MLPWENLHFLLSLTAISYESHGTHLWFTISSYAAQIGQSVSNVPKWFATECWSRISHKVSAVVYLLMKAEQRSVILMHDSKNERGALLDPSWKNDCHLLACFLTDEWYLESSTNLSPWCPLLFEDRSRQQCACRDSGLQWLVQLNHDFIFM